MTSHFLINKNNYLVLINPDKREEKNTRKGSKSISRFFINFCGKIMSQLVHRPNY